MNIHFKILYVHVDRYTGYSGKKIGLFYYIHQAQATFYHLAKCWKFSSLQAVCHCNTSMVYLFLPDYTQKYKDLLGVLFTPAIPSSYEKFLLGSSPSPTPQLAQHRAEPPLKNPMPPPRGDPGTEGCRISPSNPFRETQLPAWVKTCSIKSGQR